MNTALFIAHFITHPESKMIDELKNSVAVQSEFTSGATNLDNMSRHSLFPGISDRISGTAGRAVEYRNKPGSMVDNPLVPLLICVAGISV